MGTMFAAEDDSSPPNFTPVGPDAVPVAVVVFTSESFSSSQLPAVSVSIGGGVVWLELPPQEQSHNVAAPTIKVAANLLRACTFIFSPLSPWGARMGKRLWFF
jgi:hypothetical protein